MNDNYLNKQNYKKFLFSQSTFTANFKIIKVKCSRLMNTRTHIIIEDIILTGEYSFDVCLFRVELINMCLAVLIIKKCVICFFKKLTGK
jgi:hypothetical protein